MEGEGSLASICGARPTAVPLWPFPWKRMTSGHRVSAKPTRLDVVHVYVMFLSLQDLSELVNA